MTENPSDLNLNQPSTSGTQQIKLLQDNQLQPPILDSDITQHTTANETSNDEIKILDEIINNEVNQILVYSQPFHKLFVRF